MITLLDCLRAACEAGGVPVEGMFAVTRARGPMRARWLTIWLYREIRPETTWAFIGRQLRRERSAIKNGYRQAGRLLESDPEFRELYAKSLDLLSNKAPGQSHEMRPAA